MKFVIATNNKKKLKELSAILETLGIDALSLKEAGVETDVEETGTTFAENARLKAENAMKITGLPAVADDSGLEVFALGGEPGIYSARYGGDLPDDEARYMYLLSNMRGIEDRTARFVSTICCTFPEGEEILVEGEVRGEILEIAIGDGGFGYDPVFYLPDEECTMAQLSAERKNEISHRANALVKFKEELVKRM
ncbi:MAG: XTP/dITP diphosphatase [Clostridia bacterium]|nr:XTP/dITP diphosphatase [Clostridia bacterium]